MSGNSGRTLTFQRRKSGTNPAQIRRKSGANPAQIRHRLRPRRTGQSSKTKKSIHHLGEDWLVTLENVSMGKWRLFIVPEKIGWSLWRTFRWGNEDYSSFRRRLVGRSGERFDGEMKIIHLSGEDWLVALENVSMGKWRLFIVPEKIGWSLWRTFRWGNEDYSSFRRRLVDRSGEHFDGEMKIIHRSGEDWLIALENVSMGKWRLFIVPEKIGWSLWRTFRWGNEDYSSFRRRLVGRSGERFDGEMKIIHRSGEDWLIALENVSMGKWRLFIVPEKIGWSL